MGTVSAALCGQGSVPPPLDLMSISIRPVHHHDFGNSCTPSVATVQVKNSVLGFFFSLEVASSRPQLYAAPAEKAPGAYSRKLVQQVS